jgi:hypothetical protein
MIAICFNSRFSCVTKSMKILQIFILVLNFISWKYFYKKLTHDSKTSVKNNIIIRRSIFYTILEENTPFSSKLHDENCHLKFQESPKEMSKYPVSIIANIKGVPDKVIHYICQNMEPLWPQFQISFVRMETTYYKDKPQKLVW